MTGPLFNKPLKQIIMNKRNEWKNLLKFYNKELKEENAKVIVDKDEDGYYQVYIELNGKREEFATNNFEEELSDLVFSAYQEVLYRKVYVLTVVNEDSVSQIEGVFRSLPAAQKKMRELYDFEVADSKASGYEEPYLEHDFNVTKARVYRSEDWNLSWSIICCTITTD